MSRLPISMNRPPKASSSRPAPLAPPRDRVEDDVDPVAARVPSDLVGERGAARVVDVLDTHVAQQLSPMRTTRGRIDLAPRGPARPGEDLVPTDKVLIHSGTGGVGQAAIAIARAAGCEIYATAGSPHRRQLLRDMGIEHVYDSRSTAVRGPDPPATPARGADVVLNSLPGAAQRAGLDCWPSVGGSSRSASATSTATPGSGFPVPARPLMYAVDLALMTHSHPETVRNVCSPPCTSRPADGALPVPATTHYPMSDAATAVRLIGGAGHSGKVVLDVPQRGQAAWRWCHRRRPGLPTGRRVRRDGRHGRPRTVPRSRDGGGGLRTDRAESSSAPSADAQETIDGSAPTGVDIHVGTGDVAEPGTAERLVAAATDRGFRSAACCMRPRWSRTPRWPTSPMRSSTAAGRQRCMAPGTFIEHFARPRPSTRSTGSARFRRPPHWSARPDNLVVRTKPKRVGGSRGDRLRLRSGTRSSGATRRRRARA